MNSDTTKQETSGASTSFTRKEIAGKSASAPYLWVPSLYLGEALPFSAVMLISVIMFKEMQLTDEQITLYTGWLGLPWVIKPIWSTIIDNLKTKR